MKRADLFDRVNKLLFVIETHKNLSGLHDIVKIGKFKSTFIHLG